MLPFEQNPKINPLNKMDWQPEASGMSAQVSFLKANCSPFSSSVCINLMFINESKD